ncbi:hypothetical protein [Pseudomarimonas arenosa]|uniref:Uncharacterized protein n=1 Tax=Pseudomarimonas arenosa TaxID=2774145 RepID=A0AAW3ZMN4_9GAMM|nr:hypothetical protein [Pseudomarimonas arenosa]MBD8526337.1 hypothetical protein [Pseudomarimonas arenosa]
MARDFDWRCLARQETQGLQGWRDRYDDVQRVGQQEWWLLIDGLRSLEEQDRALSAHDSPPAASIDAHRQRLLSEFFAATRKLRSRRKPRRLYLAHSRRRLGAAVTCANLTHDLRFAFWLDAFEAPQLDQGACSAGLAKVLSAAALEMALLNCSHILLLDSLALDGAEWGGYLRARGMEHLPLEQRLRRMAESELGGSEQAEGAAEAALRNLSNWLLEPKSKRSIARYRMAAAH